MYINDLELAHGEHAFACVDDQIVMRKPKMPKRWKFWKEFPKETEIDARLSQFQVPRVEVIAKETHFVVPEVWPELAFALLQHGCPNVHFWWLSVDNFPLTSLKQLLHQKLIRSCSNLCQSEYAADFARKNGATDVTMLTDFIDLDEIAAPIPTEDRTYDICYLPNKARGADEIWSELEQDFNLVPLQNMSRAEIVSTLADCKIFLDCGFHPGKDRVPREAALCGCLPLVRREGAARFENDVPLPDSLFAPTELFLEPQRLRSKIHDVLESSAKFDGVLEQYRTVIRGEREVFEEELRALIARV
ncbi:hypothetical protein KMP13_16225 [Epibacterium ulvae]|uniref:hypothetical protein n=1 Tax=Epibacterium ulvae TaxID=1156985 RepID=UPI001BFC4996|nr:hypothetical protein [Epibacterium ulvae]MBT8155386.1 hypothetical protein [Epibacterium ulvae]